LESEPIPETIEKAARYLWLTKLLGKDISDEQLQAALHLDCNIKVESMVSKVVRYFVKIGSKYYELKEDYARDAIFVREEGDKEFKLLIDGEKARKL